jgi:hypothetical protein
MGTCRSGHTWVEPAGANDITARNASAVEPARALVGLITNGTSSLQAGDQRAMQTRRSRPPNVGYIATLH